MHRLMRSRGFTNAAEGRGWRGRGSHDREARTGLRPLRRSPGRMVSRSARPPGKRRRRSQGASVKLPFFTDAAHVGRAAATPPPDSRRVTEPRRGSSEDRRYQCRRRASMGHVATQDTRSDFERVGAPAARRLTFKARRAGVLRGPRTRPTCSSEPPLLLVSASGPAMFPSRPARGSVVCKNSGRAILWVKQSCPPPSLLG